MQQEENKKNQQEHGGAVFLLAISPIGRAIADRIRSDRQVAGNDSIRHLQESQQAMLDDLEAMRQELGEVQERLDFTERMLAGQREASRLGPGAPPHEPGGSPARPFP